MISLNDNLEKLKKELWHLNNVKLPELQKLIEESGLSDLSSINQSLTTLQTTVSTVVDDIDTLQGATTQLESDVDLLEGSVTTINNNITAIDNNINTLESDIATIDSSIDEIATSIDGINNNLSLLLSTSNSHGQSISEINEELTTLNSSVSSMSTTVSNLSTQQTALSNNFYPLQTEHDNLMDDFESLKTLHYALTTTVSNQGVQQNGFASSLEGLESDLSTLSTTVSALEDTVSNLPTGEEPVEADEIIVVYDRSSTDSAINRNLPDGIVIGNSISLDLSAYSSIRIFCDFDGVGAQANVRINEDREAKDFCVYAATNFFTKHYVTKFSIPASKKLFVTSYIGEIVVSSSGTVTQSLYNMNSDFYVYRIEARK